MMGRQALTPDEPSVPSELGIDFGGEWTYPRRMPYSHIMRPTGALRPLRLGH